MGDGRLLEFLDAGCREGLPLEWQVELAPWLTAWEAEARVAAGVIRVIQDPSTAADAPDIGIDWPRLHRLDAQVFGIRFAVYGVSYRAEDLMLPHPDSIVRGENLTDLIIATALKHLLEGSSKA